MDVMEILEYMIMNDYEYEERQKYYKLKKKIEIKKRKRESETYIKIENGISDLNLKNKIENEIWY